MTCSTCGAQVGAVDTACGSCGAAVLTAVRLPSPPPSEGSTASNGGPETKPQRPQPRSTKVLAIAAGVALVLAIGVGVSRTQVAGRLSKSNDALRDTNARLDTATARADQLAAQLQLAEEAEAVLHTQLDDAQAAERDARESLTACQDLFKLGAGYVNGGQISNGSKAKAAAELVSCFEGKLPRF